MSGQCAPDIAYQKDIFISSGLSSNKTTSSFLPRFTWHGFRYVAVSLLSIGGEEGETMNDMIQSIEGLALRTDVQVAGSFKVAVVPSSTLSKEKHLLEKIFHMASNTHSSNLMSIQSDCPHRERFGYGGDMMATAQTAMHLFKMSSFYRKRIIDYNDAQRQNGGFTETAPDVGISDQGVDTDGSGPIGWATVQPMLQTWMWQNYGDASISQESYNATMNWIEMLNQVDETRIENGLSDWMNVEPSNVHRLTGHVFTWMNQHAWATINHLLGHTDVAIQAEHQAFSSQTALNELFLQQDDGTYKDAMTFNLTQCGQSMPLYYNLVPDKKIELVQSQLNVSLFELGNHTEPHLAVGMFCILPLLSSLPVNVAYALVTREDYPSYGYMLSKGATTLWESWFYSNDTYSHNHPMFSSVVVWMFQALGGITQATWSVGWSHIIFRPRCPCKFNTSSSSTSMPMMPGVNITLDTVRGAIESNWTAHGFGGGGSGSGSGSGFSWHFTIPYGSVALVDLEGIDNYRMKAGTYVLDGIDLCAP
jgi:alpha-L-rhamnosidase